MIERGPIVIDLDPQRPGVVVDLRYATRPTLALRFGYDLSPPITDLEIDEVAISGTLMFGGVGFPVVVPWSAVIAVRLESTGESVQWPDGGRVAAVVPTGHDVVPVATPSDKRAVLDAMLAHGPVLVHLDARRSGVMVPDPHRDAADLSLRLGHHVSPPIPDLSIDDVRIACTLHFANTPHAVVLPWAAIFAVRCEDGSASTVWTADVPADVRT